MYVLGKRKDLDLEDRLEPIFIHDRPEKMPFLMPNEILICAYDRRIYTDMIVCETLEDMQKLYDGYAEGLAVAIDWFKLGGAFLIDVEMIVVQPGNMPGFHDLMTELIGAIISGEEPEEEPADGAWLSLTNQFSSREMHYIQTMSVDQLIVGILDADQLVALRILAELLLHEDSRLDELLTHKLLNSYWRNYQQLPDWDPRDKSYAEQLELKVKALQATAKS